MPEQNHARTPSRPHCDDCRRTALLVPSRLDREEQNSPTTPLQSAQPQRQCEQFSAPSLSHTTPQMFRSYLQSIHATHKPQATHSHTDTRTHTTPRHHHTDTHLSTTTYACICRLCFSLSLVLFLRLTRCFAIVRDRRHVCGRGCSHNLG